jgi:hypothetical protein
MLLKERRMIVYYDRLFRIVVSQTRRGVPKKSVCRPQAAVAPGPQYQSVAAGLAGSAPGPSNTLASLVAECKQDTDDKVKAYLTYIIWIITRSLVLR